MSELEKQGSVDLSVFQNSGLDSGFEGTDAFKTYKTPFVRILQGLSPELDKTDAKYIEGASIGQFCNSASQKLYDELRVVVLKIEHVLVAWKPNRGGFVGRYDLSEENKVVFQQEGLKKWDEEGNIIMDTIELYCMSIDDPSDVFIFPFSATSLKYARGFATRIRLLSVDGKQVKVTWAGVWKIKTVKESNDQGFWFTIGNTPEFDRLVTREEIETHIKPAKGLLKKAETDYSTIESTADEATDTGESVDF